MRPVEPDGSVRVKRAGQRRLRDLGARCQRPAHRAARTTTGCSCAPARYSPATAATIRTRPDSHGRSNLFAAANAGAPGTGVPFPNTNPALFADFGETMAQVRARISCQTDCADLLPSTRDPLHDVWTDPVAAGRAPDAPFSYDYADLGTPAPTTPDCVVSWRSGCRITIHYERHIHPLWSLPRVTRPPTARWRGTTPA